MEAFLRPIIEMTEILTMAMAFQFPPNNFHLRKRLRRLLFTFMTVIPTSFGFEAISCIEFTQPNDY